MNCETLIPSKMMSDIKLTSARFKVRRAGQDSKESQRAHKYSKDDPNRCFVTIHTHWDRAVWAVSHPTRSAEEMCGFCIQYSKQFTKVPYQSCDIFADMGDTRMTLILINRNIVSKISYSDSSF